MSPLPELPSDSTSKGNALGPGCIPATQWSIFLFFLTNYLAHCLTIKSQPADSGREIAVSALLALFFPSTGILQALDSIFRRARFVKGDELQQALRAGALCMVTRKSKWIPQDGDKLSNVYFDGLVREDPFHDVYNGTGRGDLDNPFGEDQYEMTTGLLNDDMHLTNEDGPTE